MPLDPFFTAKSKVKMKRILWYWPPPKKKRRPQKSKYGAKGFMVVSDQKREALKEQIKSLVMIEPFSGCWLWEAGCFGNRRPNQIRPALWVNGKQYLAYRISFEVFRHEIPDGIEALHSCDTSICVNPGHIFLGTQSDNMHDSWDKGRRPRKYRPSVKPRGLLAQRLARPLLDKES